MALSVSSCLFQSPQVAAQDWVQALSAQDMSRLTAGTCDAAHPALQNLRAAASIVGILGGQYLDAVQPRFSADALTYETTRNDGQSAVIRVTGEIRIAVSLVSFPQEVDFTMRMTKERGLWRFCP